MAIVLACAGAAVAHPYKHPLIVAGKVSTFGPPGEGEGTTASGASSSAAGIALYGHGDTLGRRFCVTIQRARYSAVLPQTDVGPAPWTGRSIDITGAGAAKMRIRGAFPTDSQGHARLLPRRRGPEWRCGER